MRDRGCANADALLGCCFDLLANLGTYFRCNVMKVVDEHDVVAASDLPGDHVEASRAVLLRGAAAPIGGYPALDVRLCLRDERDAALTSNGCRQFASDLQAFSLRSFNRPTHPRQDIRPQVVGRLD